MLYWLTGIGLILIPNLVLAADFVPLIGIPGVGGADLTTQTYVDLVYRFAIAVAAFLAVIKLIFAGVQFVLSDIVTSRESAKNDIRGALIGLLIVISAVLILNTINPSLTNFTLFKNVPTPERKYFQVIKAPENLPRDVVQTLTNCDSETCTAEVTTCKAQAGYVTHQVLAKRLACYTSPSLAGRQAQEKAPLFDDISEADLLLLADFNAETEVVHKMIEFDNSRSGLTSRNGLRTECSDLFGSNMRFVIKDPYVGRENSNVQIAFCFGPK